MSLKIFDSSGYINIRGILSEGYPFNFVVGGRGTGKTYTALKTVIEDHIPFLLMRRTQQQADIISKPEFSVFKPLNRDMGLDIKSKPVSRYSGMFYIEESEKIHPLGYTCALSTISSMRGFDASDIELLIYDEFIPEPHERLLKNEAEALMNAYETVNRNRELTGHKPLQLICLANANDISNPVFAYLDMVRIADKLQQSGSMRWTDKARGIQLIMLTHSPISSRKSGTVLYSLTAGTDFSAMALSNDFRVDRSHIRSRPLSEYYPVCQIGSICIYHHKAKKRLYCTTHKSGVFNSTYADTETDRLAYQRTYRTHWNHYISGKMDFSDLTCETLFQKYWNY